MTDDELTEEIRMLAAVKLYELGRISSGRAAEFAGISRVEFLNELGRYNVSPFQITPEELKAEVKGLNEGQTAPAVPTKRRRRPGSAKGLVHISEDFDEPLEDFREYM